MDRIFSTSDIEDIITKDKKVIKDVLDVISDIKSVASSASQHMSEVPSEARSGNVSGAAGTIKRSIDNDAYDSAKKKLDCCKNNLDGIKLMDSFFSNELSKLTNSTNQIKKVIDGLNSFILNTPLDTPANEYGALLSAKTAVWEKILKSVDSDIEAIKKAAKGGEKFSSVFSSDPVNLSTGNFVYEKTDLEYGGLETFCFKRFYNSVNDYEGILGRDWITNFEIKLFFKKSKVFEHPEITIIKEDGKEENFLPTDEHHYVPEFNSLAELHVLKKGYEYVTLDGRRYLFDKEGVLTRYENSNEQGYSLEYLEQSQEKTEENCENRVNKSSLHKVIKDSGEYFVFAYSEDGYLSTVTDSEGRTVTYKVEDGKLTSVTRPDGTAFKYIYSASGKLRGVINPRDIVTVENDYDADFRVTKQRFPDGTSMSYEYDDDNMIITQTERNGAVTKHYHDESMRNIKNVYPDGEESFVYNERNQKIQINDKNGNITQLTYDNRGNMTGILNPLGKKVSVTYNSQNKPMVISINGKEKIHNSFDRKGNLLETRDALGRKTELEYNSAGQPIKIKVPDGSIRKVSYDDRGNVIEIEDAQGNKTRFSYDIYNRVVETIDPSGAKRKYKYDVMDNIIEETNAEGKTRNYRYNESGKVTEITDYDGKKVSRSYNALNKPEIITDKEGRETKLQYDSMWNLARVTAPDGGQTTYIYNENNRLTRIKDALGNTTRFTYDGMGNRLSVEDAEGAKTAFEYDALGRMTRIIDSEGYEIRYEYDDEDNLIKIIDKAGNILTREFDAVGQVIEEKLVQMTKTSENIPESIRKYTYDLLGNVTSVTTETGLVTRYSYLPGTEKITEVLYNDGNKVSYTYNPNGYVACKTDIYGVTLNYKYDSLNRLIEIIGSEGETKKYTYDALGNVTSMTDVLGNVTRYEYSPSGKLTKVTDALGNSAEYTYDLNDRLIGINQKGTTEELPRGTEYKRNILGQVETVTDAIGQKEIYKYNKRGELIEKIDKEGYITKYGYTSRGDISSLQYSDGREVMLSYDALRRLTEVKDWLGTTRITNDSLGRTTEVIYPDNRKVSYTYNSLNQRTGIIYPDGKQVNYSFDENARLSELVTFDPERETNTDVSESSVIKYSYNNLGRLTEKTFPNGTETTYEYNDKGLLTRLAHIDKEGLLDEYIYSYDAASNKTGIVKNRRGLEAESGTYSYGYDPIGRLRTVTKDNKLLRKYSYDAFSNRTLLEEMTGENAGVTRYTYDSLNQLTEKTTFNSADSVIDRESYSYDKRGNLAEIINNGQIKIQYVYGAINRLEEVVNSEKGGAKYIYDGLGHRVGKEEYAELEVPMAEIPVPEKKINYLIDLTKEYHNLLEREITSEINDVEKITEYDRIKNEIFIWDENIAGKIYDDRYDYYLKDDLGSTIRLIDEDGELMDSYGYDEFGNDLYDNQGMNQPFGYTGYQIDSISNTYFAEAREFRSLEGRFCGRDWISGNISDIKSHNAYSYCKNMPIDFIDLNGKKPSKKSKSDDKFKWDDTNIEDDSLSGEIDYSIPDEDSEYIAAIYLLKKKGAAGNGHAAIALLKNNGQADVYSIGMGEDLDAAFGTYCKDGSPSSLDFYNDFLDNDYNLQHDNGKPYNENQEDDDIYSHFVYIPITNEEGIKMKSKADYIRNTECKENKKNYNLFSYNCNQQVQKVLGAGDKKFAPTGFDWFDTKPNNVYKNIVKEIKDGKRPGWYYGPLDNLKDTFEECVE